MMEESLPSASEIAGYFKQWIRPNINGELKNVTIMVKIEDKFRLSCAEYGSIVGNIEWEYLSQNTLERHFKAHLVLGKKDDYLPVKCDFDGVVKLDKWSPCRLKMNYRNDTIELSAELEFDFAISGKVSRVKDSDPLFDDVITIPSSYALLVCHIPVKLFRLWMRGELYDGTIEKPNYNGVFIEYDSELYPSRFVELVRNLGSTAFEKFRELGIISPTVIELVSGQKPRKDNTAEFTEIAIREELLMKRLEKVLPHQGKVYSLSEWGKLLGGIRATATRDTLLALENGLVTVNKNAVGSKSIKITEKGEKVLQAYREI